MITEQEIDHAISDIEKEWHKNGYFGDVRNDSGLIYAVIERLCSNTVRVPKTPTRKMIDRMQEVEEDGYEAMWRAAIDAYHTA